MRVASLNLVDLAMAQQGGSGNWFLVREPFLGVSGLLALTTMAAVWQADDTPSPPSAVWSVSLALARPLVAAHVFSVLYLGGWWAVAPFLDGWPWLNSILKTLVVFALLLWLRQRGWIASAWLASWLPLVAVLAALGSLAWLVLGGGVL